MSTIRIHERFLRHIWLHLAETFDPLVLTDGRLVAIEDPGQLNVDAGPDVVRARLRIGDTVLAGPVEIHRTLDEWRLHGHAADPAYNAVILHVLLDRPDTGSSTTTLSGRVVPMLVLADNIREPLRRTWLSAIEAERRARTTGIRCSLKNADVPPGTLSDWLDHIEVERLEVKLRRFDERLRELALRRSYSVREGEEPWTEDAEPGPPDEIPPPFPELTRIDLARRDIWDQLLFEGVLEGLGYSKNRRPFIRLGQTLHLDIIRSLAHDSIQREALFFGVAGLLPVSSDAGDEEAQTYLNLLRHEWDIISERYHGGRLSITDWVLAPTRPYNAPALRLVAAHLLSAVIADQDLFRSMIYALRGTGPVAEFRSTMHRLLHAESGPFWSHRFGFNRRSERPVPLLGVGRKDDIIINTVLPLGLLYARTFRQPGLRKNVIRLLSEYPSTEPNTITRRMERELVRNRVLIRTAGRQQALVQLFNYYCTEERCVECAVGRWIWGQE